MPKDGKQLRDFHDILEELGEVYDSETCSLQERIEHLRGENDQLNGLVTKLQAENTSLKERVLVATNKSKAQKEEFQAIYQRLERKSDELTRKNEFYTLYIEQYNVKWQEVKRIAKLPPEFIKEMNELSHKLLQSIRKSKSPETGLVKSLKLRISKSKKQTRYREEPSKTNNQHNIPQVNDSTTSFKIRDDFDETCDIPSQMINKMEDSTNNRKKPPRRKASSSDEDKTTQLFHSSRNLVAETLPQEEANETTVDYNLISPPSLTSTPIPLDIDNDATVDFQVPITPLTNVANSRRISKIKGCTQFDFKAPSPKTLSKLPSSDSKFPVDFSFTQPHSPTLPSRSHSSVGDSSDVPSPSLLTLGKNGVVRNLEQGFDFTSPASSTSCKDKSCAVVDTKTLKQATIPQVSSLWKRSSKDCVLRKRKRSYQDQESRVSKIEKHEVASDKQEIVTKQSVSEKDVIVLDDSCKLTSPGPDCSNLDLFDGIPGTPQGRVDLSEDQVDQEDIVCYDKNDEENVSDIGNMQQQPPSSMEYRKQSDGPNYKFVEVVRKRDERAKLNGYTCEECEQYYRGLGLEEEEMRGRLKECSKHRARFSPPPNTPPDFWKLSFYETQEYNDKGFLKSESEVPRKPPRLKNDRNKYAAYIHQFNKKLETSQSECS